MGRTFDGVDHPAGGLAVDCGHVGDGAILLECAFELLHVWDLRLFILVHDGLDL
jgi:hypothetical protein